MIDENGSLIKESNGSLFPKPYSEIEPVLATGASLENGSWAICPNGYAMYRFSTNLLAPASIVLHGLKVDGLSKARGRSQGLSINLSQSDVIAYVQEYCAGLEALDDQYRSLIRQNIHEVRGINSALYNAAFELQEILDADYSQRGSTLQTILTGNLSGEYLTALSSSKYGTRSTMPLSRSFAR